jgi:acyl dehydratase
MSATQGQSLVERLRTYEGRSASPPRQAPDPVERSAIRRWCEALGDATPVYLDEEFAAGTRWGGIIAPPTMLQAWTLHDRRQPPPDGEGEGEAELMGHLAQAGFTSVLATNCEQEYLRVLRPGDRVTAQARIESISEEKHTKLGVGHFVTTKTTYTDAEGAAVATMSFRLLRYAPAGERGPRAAPPRPQITADPIVAVGRSQGPVVTSTRAYDSTLVGDALPPLEVPITPTLIICGAIASRDFNVLHHDRDRAIAAGSPDIFMNILTTNGLIGRFVSEWAGPAAIVERVSIRLGAPNYPYDTMTLEGCVETREDADRRVDLAVRGRNSIGEHVSGSVRVVLP